MITDLPIFEAAVLLAFCYWIYSSTAKEAFMVGAGVLFIALSLQMAATGQLPEQVKYISWKLSEAF